MKIGYIKELTQLFGDSDMFSFVSTSRLNWIGHVNTMDSKRKVIKVHNNNPRGSRIRGLLKTDGGIVYKQILIIAKLQIGKGGQKTELIVRSPLRWERSAWEDDEEEEEEDDEEEGGGREGEGEKKKKTKTKKKKKPVTSLLHLHFIHHSHTLTARSFLSVLSLGEVVKNPSACIIFFVFVRM